MLENQMKNDNAYWQIMIDDNVGEMSQSMLLAIYQLQATNNVGLALLRIVDELARLDVCNSRIVESIDNVGKQ